MPGRIPMDLGPPKYCQKCGKQLPRDVLMRARRKHYKARFCSTACRRSNWSPQNGGSLLEPRNNKELVLFYNSIEEGKSKILTDVQKLVSAQSPEDDSPEAERRLREVLCPHPVYYYASTGTENG